MRISRAIATVLLCCFPVAGTTQDANPALTKPMIGLRDECLRQFAQPKFAVIHGKVPYLSRATDLMIMLAVKPSPAERAAIRAFLPIALDCAKRGIALLEPGQAPIMYLYQLSQSPTIGGLALLADGQITYSEYSMIVDMKADEPALIARFQAEQQAQQQSIITLTCVIQNAQDLLASMNGIEFQYTIDTARGTVTASRGPAPPTAVQISPTLISFAQGDMEITISRATGRFTQLAKGNPFGLSGTCEQVHAARF